MPSTVEDRLRRHQALVLAALVIIGIVVRIAWLATTKFDTGTVVETHNVAVAFSETGVIADAFRAGQGPTAHVMPVTPVVAGTVYRGFGVDTPVAITVLTLWSLALVFGGQLLFFRAFGRLGTPITARLAAFAVAAVVPLNANLEMVDFRTWEGALAVFMGALCLDQLLRLDSAAEIGGRDVVALGFLAAACLFISPAIGVAAYAGGLLLMVRRVNPGRWPGVFAVVLVATAVVLVPWTVRNAVVMERPVVLRDNFGLELAQVFHPGALEADARAAFVARHRSIHPLGDASGTAYRALQAAGGELAYYDRLDAEARGWIAAHPGASAGIALRNLGGMLFPPAWYWSWDGFPGTGNKVRMVGHWLVSALALVGLVVGLRQVGLRYLYVAFFALLPLLPYALVQPTLRYRYLVFSLFLFIAADLVARLRRSDPRAA